MRSAKPTTTDGPDPKAYNALLNFVAMAADGPCLTGSDNDRCECVTCLARRFASDPSIEGRSTIGHLAVALHGWSVVDLLRQLDDITEAYHQQADDLAHARACCETRDTEVASVRAAAQFWQDKAERCQRRLGQDQELRAMTLEADQAATDPIVQLVAARDGEPVTLADITDAMLDPVLTDDQRPAARRSSLPRIRRRVQARVRVYSEAEDLACGNDWLTEVSAPGKRSKGYVLSDRGKMLLHLAATEDDPPVERVPSVLVTGELPVTRSGFVVGPRTMPPIPALPAGAGR